MRRFILLALVLVLVLPVMAHAAIPNNVLDQITTGFETRTAGWEAGLQAAAVHLFWELAILEFGWSMMKLAFQRPQLDDILAALVNEILFLGLFYGLLREMDVIGPAIINSMRLAAQNVAHVQTITPGQIFAGGMTIAGKVLDQMTIWHPEASAGLMLAGIVVIIVYALIVACMILALVEGYFMVAAGVLFMAFGATRWTSDLAVSILRATLSIGAKLFVIQLIAAIGTQFVMDWVAQFDQLTNASLAAIIGSSVVLLVIVRSVPDMFQRAINGVSLAHGGALIGAGAGVAAGVAGVAVGAGSLAMAAAGAGATMSQAGIMASEQIAGRVAAGTGPTTKLGTMATWTGYAVRNTASAAATDVGRRLSGSGTTHGQMAWRAAADLRERRRLAAEQQNAPQPPRP